VKRSATKSRKDNKPIVELHFVQVNRSITINEALVVDHLTSDYLIS